MKAAFGIDDGGKSRTTIFPRTSESAIAVSAGT